jgi:hypothetical protein
VLPVFGYWKACTLLIRYSVFQNKFSAKGSFYWFWYFKDLIKKSCGTTCFHRLWTLYQFKWRGEKESKEDQPEKVIQNWCCGFCFSNIMMLSFPEYFSSGNIGQADLQKVFTYWILFYHCRYFFTAPMIFLFQHGKVCNKNGWILMHQLHWQFLLLS